MSFVVPGKSSAGTRPVLAAYSLQRRPSGSSDTRRSETSASEERRLGVLLLDGTSCARDACSATDAGATSGQTQRPQTPESRPLRAHQPAVRGASLTRRAGAARGAPWLCCLSEGLLRQAHGFEGLVRVRVHPSLSDLPLPHLSDDADGDVEIRSACASASLKPDQNQRVVAGVAYLTDLEPNPLPVQR
jgi:hypothetical protein